MTITNQLNVILTFTSDNQIFISHVDIFEDRVFAFTGKSCNDGLYYTVDSIMGDY